MEVLKLIKVKNVDPHEKCNELLTIKEPLNCSWQVRIQHVFHDFKMEDDALAKHVLSLSLGFYHVITDVSALPELLWPP